MTFKDTAKEILSNLKHSSRMVLYTDTVRGKQSMRDDLWAVATSELDEALKALEEKHQQELVEAVQGASEQPKPDSTSRGELKRQIVKAGKVTSGKITFRKRVYDGWSEPITSGSQDIVEIGIDDLMHLIDTALQDQAEKLLATIDEQLQAAKTNRKYQEDVTKNERLVRDYDNVILGIGLCRQAIKEELEGGE